MRLLTLLGLVTATMALAYLAICMAVPEKVVVEERMESTLRGASASDKLQVWLDTHPMYRERSRAVRGQTVGAGLDSVHADVVTDTNGSGRLSVWRINEGDTAIWMRSAQWRFPFLLRGSKRIEGLERTLLGPPSDDNTSSEGRLH